MESTEFTLEDCTRLWEMDTSGCCGGDNGTDREIERVTPNDLWVIFLCAFLLTCLLKILSNRLRRGGSGGWSQSRSGGLVP